MSDNNLKELWQIAMNQIKDDYKRNGQEKEFQLWFNMEYLEDNIESIKVAVSNEFMWNAMKSKGYVKKVADAIKQISGLPSVEIIPEIKNEMIFKSDSSTEKEPEKIETTEEVKPSEQKLNDNLKVKFKHATLNENFTFDTFITGEGSSSNFAFKVANAVAENPGKKQNPILFYGGVGLGKTHLMQAIGNRIHELNGNSKKICYIQAESFTNEFTESIKNHTPEKFKNKYRNLDVLLIDDIHFLQGKEGTQQELFYIFEALHGKKGQMVFTCDRPLRDIEHMAERLVSRLGSGMCLDLDPPDFETRKAIISKELELKNISFPDEFIDFIARSVETNIRDLKAAVNKIVNFSDFLDRPLTLEDIQKQLSDLYSGPRIGNISIENIFKVVAGAYNITVADIKGKRRDKKISDPRHIALYIAKELTEYTFTELGNECGGRDHSSIMHACEKISDKTKTDPNFNQMINLLIKEIKQYKPKE